MKTKKRIRTEAGITEFLSFMARLPVKTKFNMHFEHCSETFTTEESSTFKFEAGSDYFLFLLKYHSTIKSHFLEVLVM